MLPSLERGMRVNETNGRPEVIFFHFFKVTKLLGSKTKNT